MSETGRALAHIGHNVTIVAASDDGQLTSSMPSPRVTVVRLPDDEFGVENRHIVTRVVCAPLDRGIAYRRRVAKCISTITGKHKPDVIEFPGYRGESVVWLAGQHRIPMIVRMHGFTAGINAVWKDHVSATMRLQLDWERKELKAADLITVVSEHEASSVRARFGADRVRVIHNSIDSGHWRRLSVEASKGTVYSQDVLFAGNLRWRKGIFVLLRAVNLLRQTGWRGRLVLAGGTSHEFERFIRLRAAFGIKLPDWVVHLGMHDRESLPGLYRDAGVCCFPSLLEPFGYTCLEAMACGGIVVGSSGTGMAEILTDPSGFLVLPGDISRLVVSLKSALSMSAEERGRMKEAAQQRVRDHFDHSVIIPQMLAVYAEAIDLYGSDAGRPGSKTPLRDASRPRLQLT